jgi:hypothetical protein
MRALWLCRRDRACRRFACVSLSVLCFLLILRLRFCLLRLRAALRFFDDFRFELRLGMFVYLLSGSESV